MVSAGFNLSLKKKSEKKTSFSHILLPLQLICGGLTDWTGLCLDLQAVLLNLIKSRLVHCVNLGTLTLARGTLDVHGSVV